SSPDSQPLNNKRHNDSDSDIELIGRVPAPKRPARYRSPVDIKPTITTTARLEPSTVHNPSLTIRGVKTEIILDSTSGQHSSAANTNTTYGCLETGCRRRFADRALMYQHMRAVHSSQRFPEWTDAVCGRPPAGPK
ncbi:unnamed protein product, partial [Medioppia subpectinata]